MTNKLSSATVFVAVNMLAAGAASAEISFYTDRSAWEAAVGGNYHEETFDNPTPYWFTLADSSRQTVENGALRATAFLGVGPLLQFDSDIRAFGGNWDLAPGLPGVGLEIFFKNGVSVGQQIDRNYTGGFFGFVSDRPVGTEIYIYGGTQGTGTNRETFSLDNVVLASAVPEPETYALMLAGLGVVIGAVRRQTRG